MVLPRQVWLVEVAAPADGVAALADVRAALELAAVIQPAVVEARAEYAGGMIVLELMTESSDAGRASLIALPVAGQALGTLPIVAQSARAA
jgi:hypothetical protein